MKIRCAPILAFPIRRPTLEGGEMLQDSLRWSVKGIHVKIFPGVALLLDVL